MHLANIIAATSTYAAIPLNRAGTYLRKMKEAGHAKTGRQPRYDGLTVYLPDASQLRRGDILLTRSAEGDHKKGLAQAKVVRAVSRGDFDHALICTVPPTFVEAVGTGVKTLSVQNGFAHDLRHVRVLRYPDPEVAERAAVYAQRQVGRDYSSKKAMASVFPASVVDEINDRGTFCSALVAQAFVDAGAPLFSQDKVGKTTPATLEQMGGLEDITAQVFRGGLAPLNVETMVALDGDRPISLSEPQTEITGRYAKTLAPLGEALVSTFPEVGLKVPNTFYDCLLLVMDAIDATDRVAKDRLELYVKAVMDLDNLAAALIETGELAALHEAMVQHDTHELLRNLAESFNPRPDIDVTAMAGMLEATYGQIESRTKALQSFRAWGGLHASAAMTAWVELQAPTIIPFQQRAAACEEILSRLGAKPKQ